MDITSISNSTENTLLIGRILGELLAPGALITLSGPLGAGKTVIAKGIALGLQIETPIVSPTYTIAAEYAGRMPLTHIDLYRTDSDEELELLGFDELAARDGVTLIEWGEKAESFLTDDTMRITIGICEDDRRSVVIANIPEEIYEGILERMKGAGL